MDDCSCEQLGRCFPANFVFGAATAAYQIEGSPHSDGKGESIWDRFCRRPGAIDRGESGDVACDHYRLWREDVAVMRSLGLEAYRFSVAWSRVQPNGMGEANLAGLAFYDRLVDGLLEAGIMPFLTLYHWDLPQALQDRGGWGEREIASRFADYAAILARALGDRVTHFTSLNEPWNFAFEGHLFGHHPPGKHDPWLAMRVVHHSILAHAEAQAAIKAERPEAQVGIALSVSPKIPATASRRDAVAARKADLAMNRLYLDPILRGAYADEAKRLCGPFFPQVRAEDEALIASTKPGFLGINTYTRERARFAWNIPWFQFWVDADDVPEAEFELDGAQYTNMGSEVYPPALRQMLERLRDEYGNPPVFVTENGASFHDELEGDEVHDPKRVAYLEDYLAEAATAVKGGCDLRGYFFWSLMDNFEWTYGYTKQLGLVYVDYATQRRVVKDSGKAYARIIAAHRAAGSGREVGA
ncbi:MAG: GH1 family beta-glucosidase [Spirochaetaceae bacterium]|nr:GH1 family beta-glucosidase [Spirochaetaceae bacterium]